MSESTDLHDYSSDERYVTMRSRFLARQPDLRKVEAEAIAWSELGYSRAGMAKEDRMDTGKSTVKGYHQKAAALYGMEILWTTVPGVEKKSYDRITSEDVIKMSDGEREQWLEAFQQQKEGLPQEWVNDVNPNQ